MYIYWPEQPLTGARRGVALVGTIAAIVGWVCLFLAVVAVPVIASIYHAVH